MTFPISPLKLLSNLHQNNSAKIVQPKSRSVTTVPTEIPVKIFPTTKSIPEFHIHDSSLVLNVNINLDSESMKTFMNAGAVTAGLMAGTALTSIMMGAFLKNGPNYHRVKLPPLPKIRLPKF